MFFLPTHEYAVVRVWDFSCKSTVSQCLSIAEEWQRSSTLSLMLWLKERWNVALIIPIHQQTKRQVSLVGVSETLVPSHWKSQLWCVLIELYKCNKHERRCTVLHEKVGLAELGFWSLSNWLGSLGKKPWKNHASSSGRSHGLLTMSRWRRLAFRNPAESSCAESVILLLNDVM